ncbi:peptide-N-glycosidase [Flavobacterium psychrophilum]|nr:peptide-N-glycosidase [Flavobacterium psychrophilum]AOE52190.1 peptide-N-glycosidase [Flavobacterium psychrophilum]
MKQLFALAVLLVSFFSYSQKKPNAIKVTYQKVNMGTPVEENNPILVFSNSENSRISSKSILDNKAEFPIEQLVINYTDNSYINIAKLSTDKSVATRDSLSLKKQSFELLPDTKTILGYKCKKARTIINSNTIEVWYTNELGLKGSPSLLGQNLGLVLETIRNGNYVVTAIKVEKLRDASTYLDIIPKNIKLIDMVTHRDMIWKARFTTIEVFKDEVINFSDASKSNDSILRFANGTIILKKVKFPEIKPGSQTYVELTEQSNGDAYDRTGSVFAIPADEEHSFFNGLKNGITALPLYENGNGKKYYGVTLDGNYTPLLELIRFFTPFGIKRYNHVKLKDKMWHDIVPYREEISELQSKLSNKEYWIGTFIGNYDKGGHKINLSITIHQDNNLNNKSNFVLPLFNTTNVMEMAQQDYGTMFSSDNGLEVNFVLDKNIKNATLRYITTGHGGWEAGDEFVPKKNTILLDGQQAFAFIPWRQDCGSYRLFNPVSGNFDNGLSSSDYSRSNWCPGTVTNPEFISLGDLKAGKHTIIVKIPQGASEGNYFSAWNVSGVLIGNE